MVGAAAAVRRTAAGNQLLVGYVTVDDRFDATARRRRRCAPSCRQPLVPRLATVDAIPTRTSGKVDRDALPWPLAGGRHRPRRRRGPRRHGRLARRALARDPRRRRSRGRGDDFFDLGGGSLTAAQMVSLLRARHPEVAVGDIYDHPTVGGLADYVDALAAVGDNVTERAVPPTPLKTQAGQVVAITLLRFLAAPALAGLDPRRDQRDGLALRRGVAADGTRVDRSSSAGCCSSPRRAGCCSPRAAPGCCCAA